MRSVCLIWIAALAAACSGDAKPELEDPGPGCTTDPNACPAETTCWPVDVSGGYECLAAPEDQVAGSPCQIELRKPDCAAGLFCYPTAPSSGICSPTCTTSVDCTGGSCVAVHVVEAKYRYDIHVCEPTPVTDAGSD